MENMNTQELEVKLLEAVLYNEETGELHTPEERAENLDAIRLKLIELGNAFEKMDDISIGIRMVYIQTFIRVTETYLGINEKHEELLDAGR
jgi:hypothetical protein